MDRQSNTELRLVDAARNDRQLRAWSLAVSLLGDCIVPRGGEVGMATISEVLAACGVDNGVVRTAMSRLAGLQWVTREKVGRHSFYALTPLALAETQAASARIYADRYAHPTCRWRLYWVHDTSAEGRRKVQSELERLGAGQLDTHVLVLPDTTASRHLAGAITLLVDKMSPDQSRALVREAFDLTAVEAGYAMFGQTYSPIRAALESGRSISDFDALALRTLLVHDYRRIALHDPGIPAAYLPGDWPGLAARHIAADLWNRLFAASERWLDANAQCAAGDLPARLPDQPRF